MSSRTLLRLMILVGLLLGSAAFADEPAKRPRPNILFVCPDQHRFDWTGMNPKIPVRTPTLAHLAAEGVWFERAICASPLCAPSRACMASGREYDRCGVPDNQANFPNDQKTFYALLRDAGYRVANAGKLDLRKGAHDWGTDGMHHVGGHTYYEEWGFTDGADRAGKSDACRGVPAARDPYTDFLHRNGYIDAFARGYREKQMHLPGSGREPLITGLPDEAFDDNWVGGRALQLIRSFPKDKPWFLQVNIPGPHEPMIVTASMAERYVGTDFPPPVAPGKTPPEGHQLLRRHYAAMIENNDRWMGRFLDELKRRGELENTVIAFSSDHGEMLGDHGQWDKQVPYQPSVGVPLMFAGPGIRRGYVHHGPATTMDLMATFLDLAGVPLPRGIDSRSMRPVLEGKTDEGRSHVFSGLRAWRLVYDGRYKLVRGYDFGVSGIDNQKLPKSQWAKATGTFVTLFDLKDDPAETKNIAEQQPDVVKRLSALRP